MARGTVPGEMEPVRVLPVRTPPPLPESARPLARLFRELLGEALERGARALHLRAGEDELVVRARVGERLEVLRRGPAPLGRRVYLWIHEWLCGIDPRARHVAVGSFHAEEGRFEVERGARRARVRVHLTPCADGDLVVLDLSELVAGADPALLPEQADALARLAARERGALLVPTGRGSEGARVLDALARTWDTDARDCYAVDLPSLEDHRGITSMRSNPSVGLYPGLLLGWFDPSGPLAAAYREGLGVDTGTLWSFESYFRKLPPRSFLALGVPVPSAAALCTYLRGADLELLLAPEYLLGILEGRWVERLCPACRVPAPPSTRLPGAPLRHREAGLYRRRRGAPCTRCRGRGTDGGALLLGLVPGEELRLDLLRARRASSAAPATEIPPMALGSSLTLDERARLLALEGWASAEESGRVTGGPGARGHG